MSTLAILEILGDLKDKYKNKELSKTQVYIISSLKHKEDIDELKRVFGLNLFLICCGSSNKPELSSESDEEKKEKLFEKDKIKEIFEKSDFFVNLDEELADQSLERLFNLIFSDPFISPNKDEHFTSLAYNVAARSLSMSRQVGAVLVSENDEILSIGCNEFPKKGGGQYWNDDYNDSREFQLLKNGEKMVDSNKTEIEKIQKDLIEKISYVFSSENKNENKLKIQEAIDKSTLKYLIEFHREVHEEEEAIIGCARNGIISRNSILYSTVFPCHLCTKKIVAAGIKKVIYIEPEEIYYREKLTTDKTDAKIDEEFNVERSKVTKIFQRIDKYLSLADEEATSKKSRIQLGYFSLVEKPQYIWYLASKSANIP
ncbi:unnamed protein product [Brachionus calyciflorus]|uniref:dCMP deaminase n=1 Tax=Brachionus calyciflorus TaxID=104777 RepID=A0A814I8U8_9BILA|nr:unnamed protein product [Brachionus calyciflorus]